MSESNAPKSLPLESSGNSGALEAAKAEFLTAFAANIKDAIAATYPESAIETNAPLQELTHAQAVVAPAEQLRTAAEWQPWLEQLPNKFNGDTTNAARLLELHVTVANEIGSQIAAEKEGRFDGIGTVLTVDPDAPNLSVNTEDTSRVIISQSFLEALSNMSQDGSQHRHESTDGVTIFDGTPAEAVILGTVEEVDHIDFLQTYGTDAGLVPYMSDKTEEMTVARYDAADIEYRALCRKLQYALAHTMREGILQTLRDRIVQADVIRRQLLQRETQQEARIQDVLQQSAAGGENAADALVPNE